MAITLGSLNINDGVHYFVLLDGVNLGQPQTSWEEATNYSGNVNVQVNVQQHKALIPCTLPMMVVGSSASDLITRLNTLWTEVDKSTNTLVWDTESYDIVYSTRPEDIPRDVAYRLSFTARFTLTLMRKP